MKCILGAAVLLCVFVLNQAEFEEKKFTDGGSGGDVDKDWTNKNALKFMSLLNRGEKRKRRGVYSSEGSNSSWRFEGPDGKLRDGKRKRRGVYSSEGSNSSWRYDGPDGKLRSGYRKRRSAESMEGSDETSSKSVERVDVKDSDGKLPGSSSTLSSFEHFFIKFRGDGNKKRPADN